LQEEYGKNDLKYEGGELYLDGLSLREIADEYDTPLYVYSAERIKQNYTAYKEAFNFMNTKICYALKANFNGSVISLLTSLGAGADAVSGGELYMAKEAGINPEKIVFSGVGKSRQEIVEAIRMGVCMINIESEQELMRIEKIAAEEDVPANISFRVNPDIDPQTHPKIATGLKESKFGVPEEKALELYQRASSSPQVNVRGVHLHIGSQITSLEPFKMAASAAVELVSKIESRGITIEYIDIGGGLGISYGDFKVPAPGEIARALKPIFEGCTQKLILEPGRSIVGDAGFLLTRINYVKKGKDKNFVVVDAGFNDLLRPAMYGAHHDVIPVKKEGESITADIVGPVCESGDVIAEKRKVDGVIQNNYFAICDSGAYGFSMASNYNSRRRPAEIMIDNGWATLIRKRETYEDLVSTEA